jgi:hypothetical protein
MIKVKYNHARKFKIKPTKAKCRGSNIPSSHVDAVVVGCRIENIVCLVSKTYLKLKRVCNKCREDKYRKKRKRKRKTDNGDRI